MAKNVIMFKGGVETQEYFSIEMSKTFEEQGYNVYWYDLVVSRQSACLLWDYYKKHKKEEFIMFTFNFSGIAGEDGLYGDDFNDGGINDGSFNGGSFWNETKIPVVNMVVDHPLYYHKYMKFIPVNYTQISIDRNHAEYLNRFFPEVRTYFVPLGGTMLNAAGDILGNVPYIPIKDRPVDVIFTGNYTPIKYFDKYISGMDEEYRNFYYQLVDEASNDTDALIEHLLEEKLKRETLETVSDEALKMCMPNMMFVDLSVRFIYRAKVIASLADSGVRVHTFGAGWDLLDCKHPENIICAGSVDSQECLDRISQSKLSVNVMPWFKDGAHDRIFNSMLNGAVCVTDTSKYLLSRFNDGENLIFYSLKGIDGLAPKLLELLENNERMQCIADAGYAAVKKKHTWRERTLEILEILRIQGYLTE